MQMRRGRIVFGAVVILLSVGGSVIANSYLNRTKIAFVRSQELISKYEGTIEAIAKFNSQKQQWQANVDTLKFDFQRAVNRYNQEYATLSVSERQQREEGLSQQEKQLQNYASAINDKIQATDVEMMEGVANQINSFVEQYAQSRGLEFIIGVHNDGNIMYANSYLDITEEVLKELNGQYRGE